MLMLNKGGNFMTKRKISTIFIIFINTLPKIHHVKLTTYTHHLAGENSLHTHTALHMETHYIHTQLYIWKLTTY